MASKEYGVPGESGRTATAAVSQTCAAAHSTVWAWVVPGTTRTAPALLAEATAGSSAKQVPAGARRTSE